MPPIFSREKREELHIKLLEEGIHLIKKVGIKRMTVDEVAKEAGIGKGTFYHFFDSKEQFVLQILHYSKEKIYEYVNKARKERGGIDRETFQALLHTFSFLGESNIISYMTLEDELWLKKKLPEEFALDPEREEKITAWFLQYAIGIRKDLNYHVIANMMKIMALAAESKKELHQDALGENFALMVDMLCNYIYEK